MATPRVNMKAFYKQRKKSASISKSTTKNKNNKNKKKSVFVDLQEEFDVKERIVREFDMNMVYGPCMGMTRMERWERADRLGLNPPMDVKTFIMSGDVNLDCLWVKNSRA